ncbi:MAG TPA: RNA-binding transcriptional accessory protein [Verrucomicrobia bacterium]|nr:MAG: RNA-binding transcriptional accessory protein [Lentisphaerae bacterium GWF2_57_35]HBA85902.1 RNA-binding transcriptional accessory protein [Verrucomicrobiota bacterium]
MVAELKETESLESLSLLTEELKIAPRQIMAVAHLLTEGNTIPFIARYRKEVTGNLDEVQIGKIQERLTYYRELEDRRSTILKSIEEQGKLTDELKSKILGCTTKTVLEDLYLPYKPKRRTRAMIARERGLEPLANLILQQELAGNVEEAATPFINEENKVPTAVEALAGARDIIAEIVSENADIRAMVRQNFATEGVVVSEAVKEKTTEPTKFEQYYEFSEKVANIPSHRYLAIRRGENEGVLRQRLDVNSEPLIKRMRELMKVQERSPFAGQLSEAIEEGYKRLIAPSVELDVAVEMKMKADRAAVEIFAQNLRNLLLASPLGAKPVIGIDPGLRTGCKCVAVDATGKFLDYMVIFPSQGEHKETEARIDLVKFIAKHKPYAVAIGNGTGGRETEAFVRETLTKAGVKNMVVISVSEAGASVYSASEVAREEFPDLDLTVRGAISIGRRLQDPLAELVKTDPKSIGVGQYQHDVYQPLLQDKLEEVVVSCVNHVGVELNTASAFLLARVAGINSGLAKKITGHRDKNGIFKSRKELEKVSGLGPRAFEQAAGFLRIRNGAHPLDASAVHPERYELVERMAKDLNVKVEELVGNVALADKIDIRKYINADVGEPTLKDIVAELKKPGRDPRATFEPPKFREDVRELSDLKIGMELEGIVTNVTAFGAFVDIGVHQDGLVHISELSDNFVSDPSEVVQAGVRIKVRVLDVDMARKRVALSARSGKAGAPKTGMSGSAAPRDRRDNNGGKPRPPRQGFSANPFAGL